MSKTALKERIKKTKGDTDAITGKKLPSKSSLYDTDRITERHNGGTYTTENTRLLDPVTHMQRHDTYRIRPEHLEELKAILDDRNQVMKLKNKVSNQLMAYERRTDHGQPSVVAYMTKQLEVFDDDLLDRSKTLEKWIKAHAKEDPLIKACMGVKGIGPVTVAYVMAYINIEKADHPSSLWAYCGYDKPSHARYSKGEAGGGNKTLRTVLYNMADSQMKGRNRDEPSAYGYIYDQVKTRLENSDKITSSRNTQGALVEVAWKDAKACHRHGAAYRAVIKHFLADYWFVARELAGLPTNPTYAEAILGKEGHRTISPKERGWVW